MYTHLIKYSNFTISAKCGTAVAFGMSVCVCGGGGGVNTFMVLF